MKTARLALAVAVLGSCLAVPLALAQTVTDQYKTNKQPLDLEADVFMAQRLYVNKALRVDGGCVGCTAAVGSFSYDFPALASVSGAVTCAETPAQSVPGALISDGCAPASNLGADGGARLLTEAWLTCSMGVDVGYLKLCALFSDAGTYNLGDAGFTLRAIR